ncbi:MAG: 7-carboxy-7-deazaguanine synthase QueE [Gammaproteobacteria bacterium]|nr:7-carboxy-7-deazaguanine synthase QueE [Gammaproteobacteria bacterium]
MPRLRITEIFYSLQGETKTVGLPTVFVRLTGCPLRCQYCDSAYAFTGGTYFTVPEILDQVAQYQAQYVTVTGGEPLAQKECHDLLTALCNEGYEVSLETSGHIPLDGVDHRVVKVMDIKTPGSNECDRNHWMNLNYLQSHDQIKFVICHREDYEWAKQILSQHQLNDTCEVLFSPSYGQQDQQVLANWILEDRLPVRFQIQLHKTLWGDVPGK